MTFQLRYADADDCELLFAWRNDPTTRAMSHQSGLINFLDHKAWYFNVLADPSCTIIICSLKEEAEPIAIVRFLSIEDVATISLMVGPRHRGNGYGRICLSQSIAMFSENNPKTTKILAEVKKVNSKSVSTFCSVGFCKTEDKEQFDIFSLDL